MAGFLDEISRVYRLCTHIEQGIEGNVVEVDGEFFSKPVLESLEPHIKNLLEHKALHRLKKLRKALVKLYETGPNIP